MMARGVVYDPARVKASKDRFNTAMMTMMVVIYASEPANEWREMAMEKERKELNGDQNRSIGYTTHVNS